MSVARYRQHLEKLREAFPQPESNRFHDSYVAFSVLRALDAVDALKTNQPWIGQIPGGIPNLQEASEMERTSRSLEEVIPILVDRLEGMPIWGHPRSQTNVVPQPTVASVIGVLLASLYNPNLVSEESSRKVSWAEAEVAAMTARLIGYDPTRSSGVFTFGGTGANLYGCKIGLEKALPGSRRQGISEPAVIVGSDQSHYARLNIAGWLGIGEEQARVVPTSLDNAIRLDRLEEELRALLRDGVKIACLIATVGTTDAFGLDDVAAIVALRDRLTAEFKLPYTPHVHADAVIGWAWSVFRDYDFERNELEFRSRTVRSLANAVRRINGLSRADSVAIDFHKTGFAPYMSSLFLARDAADMSLLTRPRETMPYLFQTGTLHPGRLTLETSRSGTAPMAALANLYLLGKDGFRTLLGHLVEMAEVLREELEAHRSTTVLNGENVGTVTLFRAYPDGVDTWTIKEREIGDRSFADQVARFNQFNRRLFEVLTSDALRGDGDFLSLTDCYRVTDAGQPINALKSYILSPFVDEAHVRRVVSKVLHCRERVQSEFEPGSRAAIK